jgi:hypothetical protein
MVKIVKNKKNPIFKLVSATNEEVFYLNFSIKSLKLLFLIINKKKSFFTDEVCQKSMSILNCNQKKNFFHPYGVIHHKLFEISTPIDVSAY